jgi:hypothetical protein
MSALQYKMNRIRRWWKGVLVPPLSSPPGGLVIISLGKYKRHWTANVARAMWSYMQANYKWVIGTGIAVAAIVVTALT